MGRFYEENPESTLRFGDVVTGFHLATAQTHDLAREAPVDWSITVGTPPYLVVVTPCCSIDRKSIALAPLREIRPAFLDNSYFECDLTRINRKVAPENSLPRHVWESKIPPERKEALLATGNAYVFADCFVYAPHDLLREYTLGRAGGPVKVGYYMVDFKTLHQVDCDKITRNREAPSGVKILQLAVPARQEMREKLAFYFGRVPDEDRM